MADENTAKRPFKICNSSREGKRGIACSSLEELKAISCERFSLRPDCRAFLESDGTEVDNEEYFQFLPPQTLFMVTALNEAWTKSPTNIPIIERRFGSDSESQESYTGFDVTDGPTAALPVVLKSRILEDPMFFISLSTEELHTITNVDAEILSHELNRSTQHAQLILDSCEQELSRRTDIKQTHELLSICKKALGRAKREDDDGDINDSKKLKT